VPPNPPDPDAIRKWIDAWGRAEAAAEEQVGAGWEILEQGARGLLQESGPLWQSLSVGGMGDEEQLRECWRSIWSALQQTGQQMLDAVPASMQPTPVNPARPADAPPSSPGTDDRTSLDFPGDLLPAEAPVLLPAAFPLAILPGEGAEDERSQNTSLALVDAVFAAGLWQGRRPSPRCRRNAR